MAVELAGYQATAGQNSTTQTTTFTTTIPATVQWGYDLIFAAVSRDHVVGTAQYTCTDNDTGGNTWTRIVETADRKATVWWKKATATTASKVITVAGCVGSSCGGLTVFTGATLEYPITNITTETNASGNETHAGFTPDNDNSYVGFFVFNYTNDIDVSAVAGATLGSFTQEWAFESTGGSDCKVASWGRFSPSAVGTGNITWTQTNAATYSTAYAVRSRRRTIITHL